MQPDLWQSGPFPWAIPTANMSVMSSGDLLHVVTNDNISATRRRFGQVLIWGTAAILVAMAVAQTLQAMGRVDLGFGNWRPTLYAYITWSVALCWGQVLIRGEQGKRTLFVLPAALFVYSR